MKKILAIFEAFGAAARASAAVQNHHTPTIADLEILGIPADAMSRTLRNARA